MSVKPLHVYFDFVRGEVALGRVIFELCRETVPLACENFRGLCTGEYGRSETGQALHYRDTSIFRVQPGAFIQGGDLACNDGSSGLSIFGAEFADEATAEVDRAGLLVSAATTHNANHSQFIVSLAPLWQLGRRVVLGRVIYGLETVQRAAETVGARIADCGEVDDARLFISADPLGVEGVARIRAQNEKSRLFFEVEAPPQLSLAPATTVDAPSPLSSPERRKTPTAPADGPFAELRARFRAEMERPVRARAVRRAVEGWEIFNDEGAFNSYAKRAARLPVREEDLLAARDGTPAANSTAKRAFLAAEIAAQQRAKTAARRRTPAGPAQGHVNDRNRVFNEKLQRFFGERVRDLKNDIERPLGGAG